MLGVVQLARGQVDEARQAVERSIQLDPEDADAFGLLGHVCLSKKKWKSALEAADIGLGIDPEHDLCTNVRAIALRQLGRGEEAARSLEGQLARTPEDAGTHANVGWTHLQAGEYDQALEHFREALRLEPNHEGAREGVMEALKSRHWFYRPVLKYFFWMGRLDSRMQFGLLVGGWFLYRMAMKLAVGSSFAPLFMGVVGLYLVFVVMSWFGNPVANALLAFHPLGRMALTRWESAGAWVISGLLALAVALVVSGLGRSDAVFVTGVALAMFCISLTQTYDMEERRARIGMCAFSLVVAMLGAGWVSLAYSIEAERERLGPTLEEAQALVAEHEELQAERERLISSGASGMDAEVLELARKIETFQARDSALSASLNEPGRKERFEALKRKNQLAKVLGIVVAVLAFWVSQVVAVALTSWASRK